MVVTATVAVALAAGTTVTLGVHRPWTTLPLALVIGLLWWRAVRPLAAPTGADTRSAVWSLAGVAAWIVVGLYFASEYLVVTRDPGFLALTGVWLIDHPNTDIPTQGAIEAAAQQANMIPDAWQAWNLSGDVVQPQGAKMLPGVLSVGGWIDGVTGVLATNIVIGGVGILAVYLVARRLLGPLAALGPAALMALTVAHIGLSRSPYSEPLTLVLILASVLWAWRGLEERRLWPLVAAGAASGATALCRIDGGIYALGVLVGVSAICLVRGTRGIAPLAVFVAPQAAMVAAGYWSLSRWSASYLERLGDEADKLRTAYAVIVVVIVVAQLVASTPLVGTVTEYLRGRRNLLGRVAAGLTAFALVVLASRPLWMTDRRGTTGPTDPFTNSVVGAFQKAEGYQVDPTRTYAEHTITWLSYYLTWPVLALAALGLALIAWRSFTSRPGALVFLGALAVPSIVYLLRPAIVPDQLWAIRRFEPATLPCLAVAAGVGAWWLVQWAERRFGRPYMPSATSVPAILAAILMIAAPVSTYVNVWPSKEPLFSAFPSLKKPQFSLSPYVYSREEGSEFWRGKKGGARAEIDALCDVIDGRPVVLSGSPGYFGTIRVMCDVPVVLALVPPESGALARMASTWGEQPVVITRDAATVWETAPEPVYSSEFVRGEYGLQHLPRQPAKGTSTWYAGTVGADGVVTPIAPPA